jgi:hypothetical protein
LGLFRFELAQDAQQAGHIVSIQHALNPIIHHHRLLVDVIPVHYFMAVTSTGSGWMRFN